MSQRVFWVDGLRGLAIVLMVIFHFCYDLRYFGWVDWDVPNGPNWWPFRYLILTLFIFTVGVSLSLAHRPQYRWLSFRKRLLQLFLSSIAITVMSLFLFPQGWIYFGILHFITVGSILGVGLVLIPRLSLFLGSVILLGYWFGVLSKDFPFFFFRHWLPSYTEDFVPLFPWFGVLALGIGVAGIFPLRNINRPKIIPMKPFEFLGRHGLVIYLVHQPLLFAGFMLLGYWVG